MLDSIDRSVQFPNRFRATPVAGTKDILDLVSAPGEVNEEGTLWNRRASQLMQGDRRYYPVKSGQTIHAGDVVDVVGGEVGKTWRAEANVENMLNPNAATSTATLKLNTQYSVVALLHASGDQHITLVNNASGSGIVTVAFYNGTATNVSLARLSDTKFVVGYAASNIFKMRVWTVSGTYMAFGAEFNAHSFGSGGSTIVTVDPDRILEVYALNTGTGFSGGIYTINGTTITSASGGSNVSLANPSKLRATRLPDLNGNKRVCVCFSDGSDGNKGKAVIVTIKPNNTVEWGAVATFEVSPVQAIACAARDDQIYIEYISTIAYVLRLTANAIGLETTRGRVQFGETTYPAYPSIVSSADGNVMMTLVSGRQNRAYVVIDSVDAFRAGEPYIFNPSDDNYNSIDALDGAKFILSYSDKGNSSYGTATILEVQGDQIAGSFTDTSSDCIALQDATSGQQCEVIFDGVAELPGFAAGTEINSPGVYGYCPEDGRVWVRPEWDRKPFVTGSYTGTGPSVTRTIELGIIPQMIILRASENAAAYSIQNLGILFQGGTLSTGETYGKTTIELLGAKLLLNVGSTGNWNTQGTRFYFIAFEEAL